MNNLSQEDLNKIKLAIEMGQEELRLKLACQAAICCYKMTKEVYPEQVLN